MTASKKETEKRLEISRRISKSLENCVQGIMLGGSMGFGQNYSVTEKTDIDMVVVIEKNQLGELLRKDLFKGKLPREAINAFKEGKINLFWATNYLEGVEVNSFVYEKEGYIDFCTLQGSLKGYRSTKPRSSQEAFTFGGEKISFDRKIKPYEKGFIFEKPALVNGKYWGVPPRQDYFFSGDIIFEKNGLFTKLESKVWQTTVGQLLKEYGPNINLKNTNILNTHFSYQAAKEKVPLEVAEKIKNRTERLVRQYTK